VAPIGVEVRMGKSNILSSIMPVSCLISCQYPGVRIQVGFHYPDGSQAGWVVIFFTFVSLMAPVPSLRFCTVLSMENRPALAKKLIPVLGEREKEEEEEPLLGNKKKKREEKKKKKKKE